MQSLGARVPFKKEERREHRFCDAARKLRVHIDKCPISIHKVTALRMQKSVEGRHHHSCGNALPRNVSDDNSQISVRQSQKIEIIAADFLGWSHGTRKRNALELRNPMRQKSRLDMKPQLQLRLGPRLILAF